MQSCRLCDAPLNEHWTAKDAKSGEILNMSLCTQCGLVQQTSLPSDEALRIYYSHHYREDYKSTHQPKPKYVLRAGLAAKDRLAFMERAGIHPSGQRLLDIGAGGGEFCYMAAKAGFQAKGIEPHHGYSEFARREYNVEIQTCGIDELQAQQADVITLFHVFEHLAHPALVMEKVWNSLAENGVLVMEVPNIHQNDSSPHNVYFKAHLFYFSRHSLMCAASRFFELICIEDQHNLFMAFRKREKPLSAALLPSPAQVQHTALRLLEKNWPEYLIEGGGWKKVFVRLLKTRREFSVKQKTARETLDFAWHYQRRKLGWFWPATFLMGIALTWARLT